MVRTCATVLLATSLLGGCTADTTRASSPDGPPAPPTQQGSVADLPSWQPVGALGTPRDDFGTVTVDGAIWVLGGMTGDRGNRLTSIEVHDPETGTWSTLDIEMPVGLASFEAVAVDDRILVFGGLDEKSRPTDFAAALDTTTGTWQQLPDLPHARYAHTVTLHDGRVYVVGGESAAGAVPQVDVFDPRTSSWSEGGVMPQARGSHDTVSTPRGLYVLGGWRSGGPSRLVQVYDPTRGTWREAPALPEPMSRGGAAVLDGRLWVSFHEFGAALDLSTDEWAPAPHPPLSRHGHGFIELDEAVYAIGGCQEWPLRDVRTVDVLVP